MRKNSNFRISEKPRISGDLNYDSIFLSLKNSMHLVAMAKTIWIENDFEKSQKIECFKKRKIKKTQLVFCPTSS